MANKKPEPSNAPLPHRWYNLSLGSSFKDPSDKFFTLRYDFKPASIDKSQPGTLHKKKDKRVTVEFSNNQPGKPKVTFEGSSEDCKENDAVLLFDGESLKLERVHRAVNSLRHIWQPGESVGAGGSSVVGLPAESSSPPVGKGAKFQPISKPVLPSIPVEVERIEIGEFRSSDAKPGNGKVADIPSAHTNQSSTSPELKVDDLEEQLDIVDDDDLGGTANENNPAGIELPTDIEFNIPNQNDTDDEIADVDVSDDEQDKGPNAAEALRAQVNAEGREERSSSSSSSSGSESSGSGSESGSGSSSSDSESSDGDSVNSI